MPKRPAIELPDEQAKESQRIWDIWPPRLGLMTLPGFVFRADIRQLFEINSMGNGHRMRNTFRFQLQVNDFGREHYELSRVDF